MPGVNIGNPPGIRTPGIGPNGPAAIDSRLPVSSVSNLSSVPYGATNGYATPNGVTGFIGPAAGSLRRPTTWYVRVGGSNTNGGSSVSLSPDRTGSDGATNNTSSTFTAASANFTPSDIGKGITCFFQTRKIVSLISATQCVVNSPYVNTGSSKSWAIGGAMSDLRPLIGDPAVNDNVGALQSGDSVYIGAGTFRATYAYGALGIPLAFNGQVNIVGDVTGQYTGDAGMVQLTAYTTNDKTAPSATTLLNLNGKSNLAFSNIMFVSGSAVTVTATSVLSQNINFTDCAFPSGNKFEQAITAMTGVANLQFNWRFDRCAFFGAFGAAIINPTLPTSGLADYDVNIVVANCLAVGSATTNGGFRMGTASGALSFKGGGLKIRNCTLVFVPVTAGSANVSSVFPMTVYNSLLLIGTGITALGANALGQVVEDYNIIAANTARSNVNIGAHSVSDGSYAPLFHFGQERIWGGLPRMFGEPMSGSPLLSFGNDGGQTLYDLANRPRPSGGGSGNPFPAVGALERSNTAAQGTSPSPPSGTHVWQNTGPWEQEFLLPVSNTATTIAISVQRDSAYSPYRGGTLPALIILANGTLGIPAQTIVDTGASGGWNTLTAATFTPSGTGWVVVRIVSYDGTGASVVSFADVTVT